MQFAISNEKEWKEHIRLNREYGRSEFKTSKIKVSNEKPKQFPCLVENIWMQGYGSEKGYFILHFMFSYMKKIRKD